MAVAASHGGRIADIQFVESPFRFRFELPLGSYTVSAAGDNDLVVRLRARMSDRVHLHSDYG